MRSITIKTLGLMAMTLLYTNTGQALAVNPTSFKESSWPRSNVIAQNNNLPPTVEYSVNGATLMLPDWMQINFANLPPISSSGEINFPGDLVQDLGYDPSRVWQAGQSADTYMMLGDFADSFQLQEFALRNISDITQLDLSILSLADYELVSWQTAGSLTKAIPGLEKLPIGKVEPLAELFSGEGIPFGRNTEIGKLLERYDFLADLSLGNLGESLAKYGLQSIPGLGETPLKKFQDWQRSYINQIPGLNQVPFGLFPLFFGDVGFSVLGQADIVFSAAERGDPNAAGYFISGSASGYARVPYIKPVDCEAGEPCSYIELADLLGVGTSLQGKRLGSGETQTVEGGFGPLKLVRGKEPTGLLPFGPGYKVVMTGADESQGKAEFGLYLRACVQPLFAPYTCTAYSIGPIPWLPAREKEVIVISSPVQSFRVNPPISYQQEIDEILASAGVNNSCAEGCIEGDGITTGTFSHPIAPGTRVSSSYGWRNRPISGEQQFHLGIDYAAPLGTPVKSVDGGRVIKVSSNSCPDFGNSTAKRSCGGDLGNWIDVQLNNGKIVRYGHLQEGSIKVQEGMKVSRGQEIGSVGSSGWSTGPHLDLRIHDGNGNYENPAIYIK